MKRSKRLVVLSHCILNQNSVVPPLARARGAYKDFVDALIDEGVGLYQMPCPELKMLGLKRRAMDKEEYEGLVGFRDLCKMLAREVASDIEEYVSTGYEIKALVGISHSPSCDILENRGVYMQELLRLLNEKKIVLNFLEISTSFEEGRDNSSEIKKLLAFIRGGGDY